ERVAVALHELVDGPPALMAADVPALLKVLILEVVTEEDVRRDRLARAEGHGLFPRRDVDVNALGVCCEGHARGCDDGGEEKDAGLHTAELHVSRAPDDSGVHAESAAGARAGSSCR